MLFRQAALVILAGVLPLAAAGSVAPMTRGWVRKVAAWMLALIFYKPAAAAVYAAAFTMIGSGGTRTALMGFVMLAVSVVALPALMKFFTWTTGTIGGASGGGQILGTAAAGAIAVGALRSSRGGGGGSAAQDQAAYLGSRLGAPPGGQPGGATGGAPDGMPGGPASPAGTGSPGPGSARPATGGTATGGPASTAGGATGASPGGAAASAAAGAPPAGAACRRQIRGTGHGRRWGRGRRRAGWRRGRCGQPGRPGGRPPRGRRDDRRRATRRQLAHSRRPSTAACLRHLNRRTKAMTNDQFQARTYGGWRRSRSIGLLGLGPTRHVDPARLRGRAAARRRGLAQNAALRGPARAAGRRGEPDPDRRDPDRPARRAAAALVARHHRWSHQLPRRGRAAAHRRPAAPGNPGSDGAAVSRRRLRRPLRAGPRPAHRLPHRDVAGRPGLHLAGRAGRGGRLGGELGRLAGVPRLPARAALGDRHGRHRPRPRLHPHRPDRRRHRPGRPAAGAAHHGPARGHRAGGSRRRGHPGQPHFRPRRLPVPAGNRRRGDHGSGAHAARDGISARRVRRRRARPRRGGATSPESCGPRSTRRSGARSTGSSPPESGRRWRSSSTGPAPGPPGRTKRGTATGTAAARRSPGRGARPPARTCTPTSWPAWSPRAGSPNASRCSTGRSPPRQLPGCWKTRSGLRSSAASTPAAPAAT